MAYEYENETKNLITKLSSVWVESEKKEILKELQEVYRKAKAFDEIREIEKTSDITGYHEDAESYMYEVEHVIEKYDMEDKRNA